MEKLFCKLSHSRILSVRPKIIARTRSVSNLSPLAFTASLPKQKHSRAKSHQLCRLSYTYMEISTYFYRGRYMEISMYLFALYMLRYMEISVYFSAFLCTLTCVMQEGTWTFSCTLTCVVQALPFTCVTFQRNRALWDKFYHLKWICGKI